MNPRRLDDKELAVFLRYTNGVDFDEREADALDPIDYPQFILPESLELKMRSAEVNSIITYTFRVVSYPLLVDDAWGVALFDMPGTKVVRPWGPPAARWRGSSPGYTPASTTSGA